jgi:hypothetical protein
MTLGKELFPCGVCKASEIHHWCVTSMKSSESSTSCLCNHTRGMHSYCWIFNINMETATKNSNSCHCKYLSRNQMVTYQEHNGRCFGNILFLRLILTLNTAGYSWLFDQCVLCFNSILSCTALTLKTDTSSTAFSGPTRTRECNACQAPKISAEWAVHFLSS